MGVFRDVVIAFQNIISENCLLSMHYIFPVSIDTIELDILFRYGYLKRFSSHTMQILLLFGTSTQMLGKNFDR